MERCLYYTQYVIKAIHLLYYAKVFCDFEKFPARISLSERTLLPFRDLQCHLIKMPQSTENEEIKSSKSPPRGFSEEGFTSVFDANIAIFFGKRNF